MTEMHSAPAGDGASSGPDTNLKIVSVGEILDRSVPLDWHECVAVVAGLCSTLIADGTTDVPAPRAILLSPEGTIVVRGGGQKHDGVALPRLLHELLAATVPPTALRLFVLQAIASDGNTPLAAFAVVARSRKFIAPVMSPPSAAVLASWA